MGDSLVLGTLWLGVFEANLCEKLACLDEKKVRHGVLGGNVQLSAEAKATRFLLFRRMPACLRQIRKWVIF